MLPDADYAKAYIEGKNIYTEAFASNSNPYLKYKIYTNIINEMKPGQNTVVVMLNSVAFYPSNAMMAMTSDEAQYQKVPLLFLVFSHIKHKCLMICLKTLSGLTL